MNVSPYPIAVLPPQLAHWISFTSPLGSPPLKIRVALDVPHPAPPCPANAAEPSTTVEAVLPLAASDAAATETPAAKTTATSASRARMDCPPSRGRAMTQRTPATVRAGTREPGYEADRADRRPNPPAPPANGLRPPPMRTCPAS